MDCSIDSELATLIQERETGKILEFSNQVDQSLLKDLTTYLDFQTEHSGQLKNILESLLNSQMLKSAEALLLSSTPDQSSAETRAHRFEEIGRWHLKAGNNEIAGTKFSIGARLDPSNTKLVNRARLMHAPLEFKLKPPWDVLTALNGQGSPTELGNLTFFPEIYNDLLRNTFAKRFHRNRIDRFAGSFVDCSFVVKWQGQPAIRVECDIRGDQNFLSCYEVPIIFAVNPEIPQDVIGTAMSIAYICLVKTAKHLGSVNFLQLEEEHVPVITPTFTLINLLNGKSEFMDRITIDLARSEDALYKDIRKGHKSNIKWGKSNLKLSSWQSEEDGRFIDFYYNLHKETNRHPGIDNPELLKTFLNWGMVELTVAISDDTPKFLILTGINRENAIYLASVGHGQDGEALAHWPLYNSILQCKQRGMKTFDLGYVHPNSTITTDNKKHQISRFKRGFSQLGTEHIWWLTQQDFDNVNL